jgi:hypothetical protein
LLSAFKNLYRRSKYGAPIVVVSGLPRSGTSMMMKMLDAGGLPLVTDAVREADEDNPKGYFEDERVKDLERSADRAWLRDCRGRGVKIISFLLLDLPDENFYKVIFMRRKLDEVVASQNKMLERRGEAGAGGGDRDTIARYEMHLRKVEFVLEDSPNCDALDVDYRAALERPREHAVRVRDFLGMDLDVERMAAVVDPQLYRNRR